jgi:hypothetical protein
MTKQFNSLQKLPVSVAFVGLDAVGNPVAGAVAPALTWTSSHPEFATVSVEADGSVFVHAVSVGVATITATGTLPNGTVVTGSADAEVIANEVVAGTLTVTLGDPVAK